MISASARFLAHPNEIKPTRTGLVMELSVFKTRVYGMSMIWATSVAAGILPSVELDILPGGTKARNCEMAGQTNRRRRMKFVRLSPGGGTRRPPRQAQTHCRYDASAIAIGPFHRETILQMTNFAHLSAIEQDFDNIEPDLYGRIFEQPKIIESSSGEPLASLLVYGFSRSYPVLRRTGFYLNETRQS
jgi:hypothetical protein